MLATFCCDFHRTLLSSPGRCPDFLHPAIPVLWRTSYLAILDYTYAQTANRGRIGLTP